MAVPRNRHSHARKNSRRAHDAKKARTLGNCPRCSAPKPAHVACASCGAYGSRQVVSVEQ